MPARICFRPLYSSSVKYTTNVGDIWAPDNHFYRQLLNMSVTNKLRPETSVRFCSTLSFAGSVEFSNWQVLAGTNSGFADNFDQNDPFMGQGYPVQIGLYKGGDNTWEMLPRKLKIVEIEYDKSRLGTHPSSVLLLIGLLSSHTVSVRALCNGRRVCRLSVCPASDLEI